VNVNYITHSHKKEQYITKL